jgi:hypothetical protein
MQRRSTAKNSSARFQLARKNFHNNPRKHTTSCNLAWRRVDEGLVSESRTPFAMARTKPLGRDARLSRNPLYSIARDLLLSTVVEASGPRVSVPSQTLNVFQGDALLKQVGYGRDAE